MPLVSGGMAGLLLWSYVGACATTDLTVGEGSPTTWAPLPLGDIVDMQENTTSNRRMMVIPPSTESPLGPPQNASYVPLIELPDELLSVTYYFQNDYLNR